MNISISDIIMIAILIGLMLMAGLITVAYQYILYLYDNGWLSKIKDRITIRIRYMIRYIIRVIIMIYYINRVIINVIRQEICK